VNTIVREFNMTVGQMVDEFGLENCSTVVRDHYSRGNIDQWILVQHIIEPRKDRDYSMKDNRNMRFKSCYYEAGRTDDNKLLAEEGFGRFPALAARWDVNGNDVYGTGPGHDALHDMKEVNFFKSRRAMAVDYQTNPPLQVPGILRSAGVNRFPGGFTYVDQTGPENSDPVAVRRQPEPAAPGRVHGGSGEPDQGPLLRRPVPDAGERHAQRHHGDRSGRAPRRKADDARARARAPAQRAAGAADLRHLRAHDGSRPAAAGAQGAAGRADPGAVHLDARAGDARRRPGQPGPDHRHRQHARPSHWRPGVWDKINTDAVVEEYAESLGVPPSILRGEDQVAELRDQRQKQQQAAQAAAMASEAAKSAKTVGDTNPQNMQDVMNMFSGYGSPSPTEVAV
jgi:hypothetical protein